MRLLRAWESFWGYLGYLRRNRRQRKATHARRRDLRRRHRMDTLEQRVVLNADAVDDSLSTGYDTYADVSVLNNDAGTGGLTVTGVGSATNGSVQDLGGGVLRYTPNLGFSGSDSFSYTIQDGESTTDTATVSVTVAAPPMNNPPWADDYTHTFEIPYGSGWGNYDVSGLQPPSGTYGDAEDGTPTIVSNNNPGTVYAGPGYSISYQYTVQDSGYQTDTGTITINFVEGAPPTPTNNSPWANNAAFELQVPYGSGGGYYDLSGYVPQRGTHYDDPDLGDSLTTSYSGYGYTYVAPGQQYSYSYSVDDGHGGFATATVYINIVEDVAPPSVPGGSYTINEDASLQLQATNPAGLPLSLTVVDGPTHGSLSIDGSGLVTYTPAANYVGSDGFSYYVGDGQRISSPATVSVEMLSVDDVPTAMPNSFTVAEDGEVGFSASELLGNDSDPESGVTFVRIVQSPAYGTLGESVSGNETYFTYTPTANYCGGDSFVYEIVDGTGNLAQATVSINVTPVNDAPVAGGDDAGTMSEDGALVVWPSDWLGNDTDDEGAPTLESVSASAGTLVANGNGSYTFTPPENFTGTTSLIYTIADSQGLTSSAAVTITVTPVNDAPTATGGAHSITEGSSLTLSSNDVDGDALSAQVSLGPSYGLVSFADGTLTYTPSDPDFFGSDAFEYAVFDGQEWSSTVHVDVTIEPVNDAPAISAPMAQQLTTTGGMLVFSAAGGNALAVGDVEAGAKRLTLAVDHGQLSYGAGTPAQSLIISGTVAQLNAALEGLRFHAPANYAGPATLTITVDDQDATGGGPLTFTTTVALRVRPTISIADASASETAGEMTFTVTLSAACDQDVTVAWQTQADTADAADFTSAFGLLTIAAGQTTGTITVALTNDDRDEDDQTFQLQLSNPVNGVLADAVATGLIQDDEDAPLISVVSREVRETDGTVQVLVRLSHPSEKPIQVEWHPYDGSAIRGTDGNSYDWSQGTWTSPYSQEEYLDQGGYQDVWMESTGWYPVWIPDQYGDVWVDTSHYGDVWVESGYWNYNVWVDTSHYGDVWVDTSHWGDVWVPNLINEPIWIDDQLDEFGNVVTAGYWQENWVDHGSNVYQLITEGHNEWQWITEGHYEDQWVDTSHYENQWIIEGHLENQVVVPGHTESQWTTVGWFQQQWVSNWQWTTVGYAGYWTDGGVLNFAAGVTEQAAEVTILDDSETEGNENFTIQLSNPSNGVLDSASYGDVMIRANDHPLTVSTYTREVPLFAGDTWTSSIGELLEAWGAVDPDGEALSAALPFGSLTYGSLIDLGAGAFSYQAAAQGTESLNIVVTDADGFTQSVMLTFQIAPNVAPQLNPAAVMPPAPILENVAAADNPGTLVSDLIAGAVTDVNDEVLGIAIYSVESLGGIWQYDLGQGAGWADFPAGLTDANALLLSADASTRVRFLPAPNYYHVDGQADPKLTFRAWDRSNAVAGSLADASAYGGASPYSNEFANAVITVNAVNHAPVAGLAESYEVAEDGELSTDAPGLLENDSDPDGDPLQAVQVGGPQHAATFVLNDDGSFTYAPEANWSGVDTFQYQISDGVASSDIITVSLTVTPVNDAPTFTLGDDVSVAMNVGAQEIGDFLTEIAVGPSDEAGQTYTITVTTDNPELFTSTGQPAIPVENGVGKLTFNPQFAGSALVTVKLQDDGGTADGGQDTTVKTFWINVTPPVYVPGTTVPGDAGIPSVENFGAFLKSVDAVVTGGTETKTYGFHEANVPEVKHGETLALAIQGRTPALGQTATLTVDWNLSDQIVDTYVLTGTSIPGIVTRFSSHQIDLENGWLDHITVTYSIDGEVRETLQLPVRFVPETTVTLYPPAEVIYPGGATTLSGNASFVGSPLDGVYVLITGRGNTAGQQVTGLAVNQDGTFSGSVTFWYPGEYNVRVGISGIDGAFDEKIIEVIAPEGWDNPVSAEVTMSSPLKLEVLDPVAAEPITLANGTTVVDRALVRFWYGSDQSTVINYHLDGTGYVHGGSGDDVVDGSTARTVTVPAGQGYADVFIAVVDDAQQEWDENLTIVIDSVNGESPGPYSSFPTASIKLLDNDYDAVFGSNNVDSASTGLTRDTVFDGNAYVDLFDGRWSWNAPLGDGYLPTFISNYANQTFTVTTLPDSPLNVDTKFFYVVADSGIQEISPDLTLRRNYGGVGDISPAATYGPEFLALAHNPNPWIKRTDPVHGDSIEIAGFVDQLVPVATGVTPNLLQGTTSLTGFELLRRDGSSAWYQAVPSGPATTATMFFNDADAWTESNGTYLFTPDANPVGNYNGVGWKFENLDPNRSYLISSPSVMTAESYMTASTPHINVLKGTMLDDFNQVRSATSEGTHLGYYRPAADGTLILSAQEPTTVTNLTAIGDWTFITPDGSYAVLTMADAPLIPTPTTFDTARYILETKYGDRFEFNGLGYLVAERDRDGNQTRYEYEQGERLNQFGVLSEFDVRLKEITVQGGGKIKLTYEAQTGPTGNYLAAITDPTGRITKFYQDTIVSVAPQAPGDLTPAQSVEIRATIGRQVVRPDADRSEAANVNSAAVSGFLGTDSAITYIAPTGQIGKLTPSLPLGVSEPTAAYRRAYSTSEAEPQAWTYQFDRFGLMIAKAAPAVGDQSAYRGDVWQWDRNFAGQVLYARSPAGRGDTTGTSETLPATGFDVVGYRYDIVGNLEYVDYADGTSEHWTYDYLRFKQVTSYVDRTGRKKTYDLNDLGQVVVETLDPAGIHLQTKYEYTPAPSLIDGLAGGLLKSTTDAEGNRTQYDYYDNSAVDGPGRFGRLKTKTYDRVDAFGASISEELSESFLYDEFGNLVEYTDVNNVKTVSRYDRLGQLLEQRVGGSRDAVTGLLSGGVIAGANTYDAAGDQRSSTTPTPLGNAGYSSKFDFNYWNEIVKQTDPVTTGELSGRESKIAYTADGLVESTTDAYGHTITYEYDARRRRTKAIEEGATSAVVKRADGSAYTEDAETEYAYDAAGQLKSVTDALDRTTRFTYDAFGRQVRITSPAPGGSAGLTSLVTRREYDEAGRVVKEFSPNPVGTGEVYVAYFYDAAGRLARTQQPKVHVAATNGQEAYDYYLFTAYEYYDNGSVKAVRQGVTQADEPTDGRLLDLTGLVVALGSEEHDHVWSTTATTYDFLGRATRTAIHYEGATGGDVVTLTSYKLVAGKLVIAETAPRQSAWVAAVLELTPAADVSAWQTTTKYNALGQVESVQGPDPDGPGITPENALHAPLTKFDYFDDGRLRNKTETYEGGDADPNNLVTSYTYDELGRLRTETVNGITTTTTYDKLDRVVETRSSEGTYNKFYFNERGDLRRTESGKALTLLSWTDFLYDEVRTLQRQTTQSREQTTYGYDNLDRETAEQTEYLGADGYTEPQQTTQYGVTGRVTGTVYGGLTTAYVYDELGRVRTKTETQSVADQSPISRQTEYEYDDVAHTTAVIDPNGNKTTSTLDGLGQELSSSISQRQSGDLFTPTGANTSSTYDAAGNLTAYTDRNGYQFTYEYDALNRLTKETWVGDAYEISYGYNDQGLRSRVSAGGVTYEYLYSPEGLLAQKSTTFDGSATPVTLGYLYDRFNRLTSRTDNLGGAQIYGYDTAGRLNKSSLVLDDQVFVVARRYDAKNRVDQIERRVTGETTFLRSSYAYNPNNRFTDIVHEVRTDESTVVSTPLNLHYGYDAKGRLDASSGPEGSRTYQYDDLDQLIQVLSDGNTLHSYNYDAGGNHDAVDGEDYVVGENNELDSASGSGFQYDEQSNRTRRTNADGTWEQYDYDRRNRLTQVEFHDSSDALTQRIEYDYDAFDHRVARSLYDGSDALVGEEHYVYDGDTLLFVLDGAGDVQTRLFNVGSQAVGQQRAGADFEWILTDQLGSTRALVVAGGSDVGEVTAHYDYDAYGNLSESSSDPTLAVGLYAGYRYEAATGYYEAWHRWYDPTTGRWISQDPIGFDGGTTNLNEYVGNNPLNKVDPTGLHELVPDGETTRLEKYFSRPAGMSDAEYRSVYYKMPPVEMVYPKPAERITLEQMDAKSRDRVDATMLYHSVFKQLDNIGIAYWQRMARQRFGAGLSDPGREWSIPAPVLTPAQVRYYGLLAKAENAELDTSERINAINQIFEDRWEASPPSVRSFGPRYPQGNLGATTVFEQTVITLLGAAQTMKVLAGPKTAPAPSNLRQSPIVASRGMQTLDLGGQWRNAKFNSGGIVYVVRDKTTGELLKVGQTTSEKFVGRFEKYVTAGNKTGRALEIDAFEVELSQRGTIEGQIRRQLGAGSGTLLWDNTGGRLGRTGSGTPNAPSATQWRIEDGN